MLGYKGVGFGPEDAAGLRKLWRVKRKGGSEGGSETLKSHGLVQKGRVG